MNVQEMIAAMAATAEPEIGVPNPEGLIKALNKAKEEKTVLSWTEAHAAAGYEGSFRNARIGVILEVAKAEGLDPLITTSSGAYSPQVADAHLAKLAEWGYSAEVIEFLKAASVAHGLTKAKAKAKKLAMLSL